jgi:hypothetical protein
MLYHVAYYTNWWKRSSSLTLSSVLHTNNMYVVHDRVRRPGWLSRCSDLIRAWRSRIQTPVGREFSDLYELAPRPTQSPIKWIPGLFPGGKAAGAWRWQANLSEGWGSSMGKAVRLPPLCACLASNVTDLAFTWQCSETKAAYFLG